MNMYKPAKLEYVPAVQDKHDFMFEPPAGAF